MGSPPFEWIGGDASLDFHNTVTWGSGTLSEERFGSAEDVREWARATGLGGKRSLPLARRSLADALALREALHHLLSAIAHGRTPPPGAVEAFNRFLGRAGAAARIERRGTAFRWTFDGTDLDPVLAEVAWAAAHLLASPDLERLRPCANPTCGWLFLDRSRRGNRKWCEMRECGNRAKARRYYRRHRAAKVRSVSPDYS